MSIQRFSRRMFVVGASATLGAATLASYGLAAPPVGTKEPVHRVAMADPPVANPGEHPLMPAIRMAQSGLATMDSKIQDYSATLVKRERVNGELNDHEFMEVKIRNERVVNGQIVAPFAVYMKFVKPAAIAGREVVYVKGENNGKLRAHEGGTAGRFLPSLWLAPDSLLAMRGQRYPITEIGLRNLIVKLIERATDDMKNGGETLVSIRPGFKINQRESTLLQVTHPVQREHFTFHLARVYVDQELNIPIRYEAYSWPAAGGKPGVDELIEEYTYVGVKINQGFTDADFDSNNKAYNF